MNQEQAISQFSTPEGTAKFGRDFTWSMKHSIVKFLRTVSVLTFLNQNGWESIQVAHDIILSLEFLGLFFWC